MVEWDGHERRQYFRRCTDGTCALHVATIEHGNERHLDIKEKTKQLCATVAIVQTDFKREIEKLETSIDEVKEETAKAAELVEIKREIRSHLSIKNFTLIFVLILGFAGWIAVDHIGISKIVATNTQIDIQQGESIKHIEDVLKVVGENQIAMLLRWNIEPQPMPEKESKSKVGTK